MTTITTPSLELAPSGNEAAPETSLFLLVDNMGTGESMQDEAERTQPLSPFEAVDSEWYSKTGGQPEPTRTTERLVMKRLFIGGLCCIFTFT